MKNKTGCIKFILLWFFILIALTDSILAQESQQLTRDEFNTELRKALIQNNEQGTTLLIKNNRFFVKPFVDGIIKESLNAGRAGKVSYSKKLQILAEKTAAGFEQIFGEKSLRIAVNYLTMWSRDQKKTKLTADSLFAIGTQFRLGKEFEKAMEFYPKALQLYKNIGDERGESEILGHIAVLYFDQADYQSAMKYYQEALIKREKVDDKQLLGNTLNSIGSVYLRFLTDYPQAIYYYSRAEALREELGDAQGLRTTLTLKANAYLKQGMKLKDEGKYTDALANFDKSLEIQSSLDDKGKYAEVLSQMGFVYSKIGDYKTSITRLTEAAKIFVEENDSVSLAGVYNHFGISLKDAGRFERASGYFNDALKIYEEHNDQVNELAVLNNLGNLYQEQKDYTRAENYHKKGLQICRDLENKRVEVDFLLNLANDETLLNKLDEARSNYEAGGEIAKSLNNPELIWKITAGMAENYERRGDFNKAVELNDSALAILDRMRKTIGINEYRATFLANERFAYEDIINMLEMLHEKDRTKGYDKLAFGYAERCKSRVLLDLLSESDKTPGPVKTGEDNARPLSLEEAQSLCQDKNTVILEYLVGDSSSCVWVITANDHHLYKIPARKKLQEQIETIRFGLQDPDQAEPEFLTGAGYYLYQQLIEPAKSFLTRKSKLIIIPDGILNYLPFEILLTDNVEKSGKASYSGLPFLIRKYPVSYGQSASVLKSLLSKGKGDEEVSGNIKLIAFGDPVYGDEKDNDSQKVMPFRRLEYSGKEIEQIASYFGEGLSETYLRDEATEENVKKNGHLNKFNYIHFATHGLINEENPDLSSLVLTQGKSSQEDGFLQAAEIFNLDLNADLVVLSACQTGLGKLIRGEGIVGLTRAFMYAGTPSVLVSLWSVSDVSTATLMSEFYRNLIVHKLNKADALRRAQRTLLSDEKYAHPFYWAPFILIGDWK